MGIWENYILEYKNYENPDNFTDHYESLCVGMGVD